MTMNSALFEVYELYLHSTLLILQIADIIHGAKW